MSCLVVYGREPVAGRAKTRLAAALGDRTAAELYRLLLEHALRQAARSGVHTVLSLAEPASSTWSAGLGLPVELQVAGDLGQRLAATFARRFGEGWHRVVVVGSDCPGMKVRHLRSALAALAASAVVIGPAADGGYWLVGQRAPGLDLFSGIPWSAPSTLDATRRRLRELAAGWSEFETLEDIDTADDLARALASAAVPRRLRAGLARAAGQML